MKTLLYTLLPVLFLTIGCTADNTETTLQSEMQLLSAQEISDLQFLREEEKLAHNVYTYAYERYDLNIFNNIASSEQRHTDAVFNLMKNYGVEDTASETIGIFTDPELAALYANLIAKVNLSETDALLVGATIEDLDIYDLDEKATHTTNTELHTLYSNLKCGSENHMRSFTNQLNSREISYDPTYISIAEYQTILAGSQGGCGN